MKTLRYIACLAASSILSANACTILEFATENLLSVSQNTPEINFRELEAFAAGVFPTRPVFTGIDPWLKTGLNTPIDLTGFGYAVVHYAPGISGALDFSPGGSLDFYLISGDGSCEFTFPQTGPGGGFSNGPITSVALFTSESIPDAGGTVTLLTSALIALTTVRRFAKPTLPSGKSP